MVRTSPGLSSIGSTYLAAKQILCRCTLSNCRSLQLVTVSVNRFGALQASEEPIPHAVHPQYHWTDKKIRVHTFICLISSFLSQVFSKKAHEAGHNLNLET